MEWTRDDNMRGMHYLQPFFEEVIRTNRIKKVLEEKEESVRLWNEMSVMAHQLRSDLPGQADAVRASIEYGRLFFTMTSAAFNILLKGYAAELTNRHADEEAMKRAFTQYDTTWEEWDLFCRENPWSASIYKIPELEESVNRYRIKKD
ncbi:MAG: hypothetical protein LUD15_11010 [Bacteroides sp.]|nr:hypothetical protein [Bacteroides sp.]